MKNNKVLIDVLKGLLKNQKKDINRIEIKIYNSYKDKFDCLKPLIYSKDVKTIIKHLKRNYKDINVMFEVWGYRSQEIEIYIYIG